MKNNCRIGDALAELSHVAIFLVAVALMVAAPSIGAWLRSIVP